MTISYFGYGSLVNIATLGRDARIVPGQLAGWGRAWRVRGLGHTGHGVCVLTVQPRDGQIIEGVMAVEPAHRLADLQAREHKYDRVDGVGEKFRSAQSGDAGPDDMFLFQVKDEHAAWGDEDHPILQSYLDCVLAGYFEIWGWNGVARFLETTEGWHVPIFPDRESPRYARAQVIEAHLLEGIDDALAAHGVRYLPIR